MLKKSGIIHIPLVDLKSQYLSIKDEIDTCIRDVLEDTAFIRGKYVKKFEQEYAEKHKIKHCIGVANGTDALTLSLRALGIGPGDEIITTASSWISTSEAISLTGAKPIFVDIEPDYYTIDPLRIEENITKNTKAILPVHLYGQPADMNPIMEIAEDNKLFVVEDCAQAHLAEYKGQMVGTIGDAGAFSFYPSKNLGAYGDAGAVITHDTRVAEMIRRYANHGALKKHDHIIEGTNSRLDGLQAAILSVKIRYIDDWNKKRQAIARQYSFHFDQIENIKTPIIRPGSSHVYHLYVIRTPHREQLKQKLNNSNIETSVHYPCPLPLLPCYNKNKSNNKKKYEIVQSQMGEILSLPMFPELSSKQIKTVITEIKRIFNEISYP